MGCRSRAAPSGWLGYELGRHLEPVPQPPAGELDLPEMVLLLCDVVVALDNAARRAWIVSSGLPEAGSGGARGARGGAPGPRRAAPHGGAPARRRRRSPPRAPEIASTFTREAYEDAVRRVIELILAGDVFQANLSQRFRATLPGGLTPFGLFRRLDAPATRRRSPRT